MKMCCCIILYLLPVLGASGQIPSPNWDEWFKQKKTQKKYLLTQIAELKAYMALLEKGYRIANEGITTIHNIKNGEFNLHDLFYKSLAAVNPDIRRHADVAGITATQLLLVSKAAALNKKARQNSMLTTQQRAAIATTCRRLTTEALGVINQLEAAFTDGTLSMTDDRRLHTLQSLQALSRKQWAFFKSYESEATLLVQQKMREAISDQVIKSRYGIQ